MKRLNIVIIFTFIVSLPISGVGRDIIDYEIITGSKIGTYYKIGDDLAKYVAPDADIRLTVLNSKGSIDNVLKLISPSYKRLKFAIVQSDVLQELRRIAEEESGEIQINADRLINNIVVIKPLYNEEIHILTRKDSPIKSFSDLKGKKIFAGKPKSGTLMTTMLIFRGLFGERLKNYQVATSNGGDMRGNLFKQMLRKLSHKEIDAIVQVAGQPVKNLNRLVGSRASDVIKILPFTKRDVRDNLISNYYRVRIHKESYHWLDDSVPTLATKAFLVTYNYKSDKTNERIRGFIESLNRNLSKLKRFASKSENTPHLKWRQVSDECNPPLPNGWRYHPSVIEFCREFNRKDLNIGVKGECTRDDMLLGLCRGASN